MRLIKALLTVALVICISGCVGVRSLTPKEITKQYEPENTRKEVIDRYGEPDYLTENGAQYIYSHEENKWCGYTVWVVLVPIPLKAPVCDETTTYHFDGDSIDKVIKNDVFEGGLVCGPLHKMASAASDWSGTGSSWCY